MNTKKELYLKHLEKQQEGIRERLSRMIDGTSFEKLTSTNLQYIVNDLKEIEAIKKFIDEELEYIEKNGEI